MKRMGAVAATACLVTLTSGASAQDPAAAHEQLKKGYELKQAGRCDEAIPYFLESERLDPQPKALLNLADCEDRQRDLVASEQHALEARDMAQQRNDAEMLALAGERLADLSKRMPRLTIRLAGAAPADTAVARDGTALGSVSIGVPLPANPGKHVITVRAPGYAEKQYELSLDEGVVQTLVVGPGELLPPPAPSTSPSPSPPPENSAPIGETAQRPPDAPVPPWTPRKTVAILIGGAGVAGIVVGSVFGVDAINKNSDSNANGRCDATGCDPTGKLLRNDAVNEATASTVAFVAGGALLAGGVVLYLLPESRPRTARVELGPRGLSLVGRW